MDLSHLSTEPLPVSHGAKAAAVLIVLTDEDDPRLVLTTRSRDLAYHPGQVSLPGGTVDEGETPIDAALREAHEEVGIDPGVVSVAGWMEIPAVHGKQITPVVGVIDPKIEPFVASPAEVESVFMPRVSDLIDPAHRATCRLTDSRYTGPVFLADGGFVWGLTAHILQTFLDRSQLTIPWDATRIVEIPERYRSRRRWAEDS